jgi:hypothetical protein
LKNCDWSTLEKQLVQLGIEQGIRDDIQYLLSWLQNKRREDSLLASLRWSQEGNDRRRMIEVSETLNGRVFSYLAEQRDVDSRMLSYLGSVVNNDNMYYNAYMGTFTSAFASQLRATDTLRMKLERAFGDGADDIVAALERLNGTVANNGHGTSVNVEVEGMDLSGVEGGISNSNRLLSRLDSTLSAGNGNILSALDSLSSGDCGGDRCGNYDGVGDDAFAGIDTSSRYSRSGYDSLLSPPGFGGLQGSSDSLSASIRQVTATPFSPGMACPASELSFDACSVFGADCRVSLCDEMFHIKGRHFFEWVGVMFEFVAWVLFLVRIA